MGNRISHEVVVLLAGLEGSGKTTVLYKLCKVKNSKSIQTAPTVGYNTKKAVYKHTEMELWEFGNSHFMRDSQARLLSLVNGLVFVVDSTDVGKLSEALTELKNLIQIRSAGISPKSFPVLILCNKQDVQDAISKEEFENIFAASGLSQTIQQWKIVNTSALYGKGINEGFTWLISTMKPCKEESSFNRRDSSFI